MPDVQVNEQAVLAAMENTAPQVPVEADPASTPVPEVESFTGLDPNSLPPEARPFYDSMRADYTRKAQEVAALRKQYEDFGDVSTVKEQLEFYRRFDSDPAFAKQVVDSLTPRLQELFPVAPEPTPDPQDDKDYELPPALMERLTGVERQLAEANEERQAMALAQTIQRAEMAIRQDNPDYKDSDISKMYDLLHVTNGDLFAAQKWYDETRREILASYVQAKQEVPAGVQPVQTPTPHAETPHVISTMEDATKMAVEYVRNRAAGG
jgi:hypothetical protein